MENVEFYGIELIKNGGKYTYEPASTAQKRGNLMWGRFEYMSIKSIDDFTNECIEKADTANSLIYLYSLGGTSNIVFKKSDTGSLVVSENSENPHDYKFIGITLVRFSESAKQILNRDDDGTEFGKDKYLVEKAAKSIRNNDTVKAHDQITYEIFGTLNGDDLCVAALFDDIGKYLSFIETLQILEYPGKNDNDGTRLLDATYSFVSAQNLQKYADLDSDNLFSLCSGYAAIQLTYNFKCKREEIVFRILKILGLIKEDGSVDGCVQIFDALGEYDIVMLLPTNKLKAVLYAQFLDPWESDFYRNNIEQCHTRFYRATKLSKDNILSRMEIDTDDSVSVSSGQSGENQRVRDSAEKMDGALKNVGQSEQSNLNLIYKVLKSDFNKALSVIDREDIMYDDITVQYTSIISTIAGLITSYTVESEEMKYTDANCDDDDIGDKDQYDIYNAVLSLTNIFQHSIFRAKQTNMYEKFSAQTLFREVAVYDKMISCYYYVVKEALLYLYTVGNPNQSTLIPLIRFEVAAKVTSELIQSDSMSDEKVLALTMPQEAYYKTNKYIPLLFHELGHYVNPINRKTRNMYLFIIIAVVSSQYYISDIQRSSWSDELTFDILKKLVDSLISPAPGRKDNLTVYEMFENKYETLFSSTWDVFCGTMEHIMKAVLLGKKDDINICYNDIITHISNAIEIKDLLYDYDQNTAAYGEKRTYAWKHTCRYLRSVIMGLREASADCFMISMTKMTLDEYIALTMSVRIDCAMNAPDNSEMSKVRLEIIYMSFLIDELSELDTKKYPPQKNLNKNKCVELCLKLMHTEEKNDEYNEAKKKAILEAKKKEAEKQFEQIIKSLEEYGYTYMSLNRLYFNLIATTDFEMAEDACSNSLETLKLFLELLRRKGNLEPSAENYLTWINLAYRQGKLSDLSVNRKEKKSEKCDISMLNNVYRGQQAELSRNAVSHVYIPTYVVNNLDELIATFKQVNLDLEGNNDLWYRGHAASEWNLQPSMFRNFSVEDKKKCAPAVIKERISTLKQEYNDFVAMSAGSPELIGNICTEADWLSYMQHYSVRTNFLDWSERPLNALYFALENYFDPPCKLDDNELSNCSLANADGGSKNIYTKDLAIWVLNPRRMNEEFQKDNGIIPNLSIAENAADNEQYLLTKHAATKSPKYKRKKDSGNYFDLHKPKAVTVSRLSGHIRAQKGFFVVFDLYDVLNEKNKEINCIKSSDLDNMFDLCYFYKEWLKKQKSGECRHFLAKIIIPAQLKRETAKYVEQMRESLSSTYPELVNIGKDITREADKRLSK